MAGCRYNCGRFVKTSLYPPPSWSNRYVILYHGTDSEAAGRIEAGPVRVGLGKPYTDFGPGFYTTTCRHQAATWAQEVALAKGLSPALIEITVELERLDTLAFVRGEFDADQYWSFVFHCRLGAPHHNRMHPKPGCYDVVYGPVASHWRQRLAIANADQTSFHTADAEVVLNAAGRKAVPL